MKVNLNYWFTFAHFTFINLDAKIIYLINENVKKRVYDLQRLL
jgi:hypothetical protein